MSLLFGLLSDLDKKVWKDSPVEPPPDKKKMAGGTYHPWGIVKVSPEKNYLRYFLNSNTTGPDEFLLYGAERNPLKDVGHCWMAYEEKEPGKVITGMAIENDWVIMLPNYLATFKEKTGEGKVQHVLKRSETIEMGIYCDLEHDKWDKKKGKLPRGKGNLGYHYYEVLRQSDLGNKMHEIALGDDHGNSIMATITCAQRNPFHAITKGYFKIVDGIIKGVMVDDDWVEMYE